MKRVLITLLLISCGMLFPVFSKSDENTAQFELDSNGDPILPSIFIWELPENTQQIDAETSFQDEEEEEEEITLVSEEVPVKGYLEYSEGADSIFLKDDNKEFVLNLRVPQKFETSRTVAGSKLPSTTFSNNVHARSGDITYNIAPLDAGVVVAQKGNFSVGTSYNESIDKSDLGFTTSFYTKYDQKYFSLSSSYNKEAGVAYSMVVDKFSVTPELKLNRYISIKDVLTSDITRNRKQNSLIFSIKPTSDDRVRFEFGAGQTYDESRALIKSELKFSTQFNW